MTKEQSAIDKIYELVDLVNELSKKVDVIDQNVKLLNNKLSKASSIPNSQVSVHSPSPSKQPVVQDPKSVTKLVLGNIKTFGFIRRKKSREPISGVEVNVYDGQNQLIKNVKSNKDGYWQVRLPKGKYGVEYIHREFHPINKVIELDEAMDKYEVI